MGQGLDGLNLVGGSGCGGGLKSVFVLCLYVSVEEDQQVRGQQKEDS